MTDETPPDDIDSESAFDPDTAPSVSCSRCSDSWRLGYELDELGVGNRALERFALDHYRHTGHYPDDVSPWVVTCRQCPETDQYLSERPARRFGEGHARHTGHTVVLSESPNGPEQPTRGQVDADHGDDESTLIRPADLRE